MNNPTTRTVNSVRNAVTSIGGQLLNNVLKLVCRTAFIYTLGKEYLGISSYYANVLTLLSIAEMGFGTAITYCLYQPLAQNDERTVHAMMGFFRKIYTLVGLAIFAIGLCLMPFLPALMTGVTDKVNIYFYYLLYLTQTAVSYLFFSYKAVLLSADQKQYVCDIVMYICQILQNLLQIIVLFTTRSFLLYTVLIIVFTILQNIATAVVADRRYPYLKQKAPELDVQNKRSIYSKAAAAAIYKASSAIGTSTDNLLIGAFVSITAEGIFDNYTQVLVIFQRFLTGGFRALTSSIGNLYVMKDRESTEFVFRSVNLLNYFLVTYCSVCFLNLFQPFIVLWIGKDYLLSNTVLFCMVLNFATNYYENIVHIYNSACGTFVHIKYRSLATALINLVVSLILVRTLGIEGVVLGSVIARMTTVWWFDAHVLYQKAFQLPSAGYYMNYALHMGIMLFVSGIVYLLCRNLEGNLFVILGARWFACTALTTGIYWILWHKSQEYHYIMDKVVRLLHRNRK